MQTKKKITLKDFKKAVAKGMKVLHLDCETSPLEVYTFSIGKTILGHKQIKTSSKVICVQYKWEGKSKAEYLEWERVEEGFDDYTMLAKVSALVSTADIIVGQNLDNFDMKVLNGRLAQHRLPPIEYENTLDILKLSRKSFRFASQKLDFRSKYYGRRGKDPMEMQDWIDVVEGHRPVSYKMGPYGCRDVLEEQAVFYSEFDYYKTLPAKIEKIIRSFLEEKRIACPKCVAQKQARFNTVPMPGSSKYTCMNCTLIFKVRKK